MTQQPKIPDERSSVENTQLLLKAVKSQKKKKVIELLQKGANPNVTGASNTSVLSMAASDGNIEIAEALIEAKANLNAKGYAGYTPLHEAAITNKVEMVRFLLERKAEVLIYSNSGYTALTCAERSGYKKLADMLREKTQTAERIVAQRKELPKLLLQYAGQAGRTTTVESILAKLGDSGKTHAFHQAVEANNAAAIKVLLDAKVTLTDLDKNNALATAVRKLNVSTVETLLALNADPNSIFFDALYTNNAEVITALIAGRAKFDRVKSLHSAAANGQINTLRALIEAKADVNAVDHQRNTALHTAAHRSQHQAIAFLLEAKATTLQTKNDEGNTPLLMVAETTYVDRHQSLKLLLDAKSEVNAINNQGRTALHSVVQPKADRHGKLLINEEKEQIKNLVNILLEAQADTSMRDHLPRSTISTAAPTIPYRRGKTAFEYARENGHTGLYNLFPHYPSRTPDNYKRALTFFAGLHKRAGARSVMGKAYDDKRTRIADRQTLRIMERLAFSNPTPGTEPAKESEARPGPGPGPGRDSNCIIS